MFRISCDEGGDDWFTRQRFSSYDEAYDVLARYYADLCCSDERTYYRIELVEDPG
ncbi:MAG: hypothetical protein RLZZ11_1445 [Cyanobacteriota bacterium]|jgi:hypothetical protein